MGAAHHRYRVFVFAWPRVLDTGHDAGRTERGHELEHGDGLGESSAAVAATWRILHGADALGGGLHGRALDAIGGTVGRTAVAGGGEVPEFVAIPTPTAERDGNTPETHLARKPGRKVVTSLDVVVNHCLPTPSAYAGERGGPQDPAKRREGGHRAELDDVVSFLPTVNVKNNDNQQSPGYGPNIGEALRSLPTPRAGDGTKGGPNQAGSSGDLMLPSAVQDWREYEPAIRRQEAAFGRPAPLPTEVGPKGSPRLSARFSEWLMGLPDGWITDPAMWADVKPSTARNQQLKLAGNGVVPQQCYAAALRFSADFGRLVMGVAA